MTATSLLAKHVRELHFGGNWTSVNLKDALTGITWQQAVTHVYSLNTIVKLVYHINYYIAVVSKVLNGGPFDAHDKFAFDHPPINSESDWQNLVSKSLDDAENFAALIEKLPDSKLQEVFVQEKYGTYYRNFQGIIEHTHYHLGQIVVIKKLIQVDGLGDHEGFH